MSSSNVSSVTSHFPTSNEGFVTTLGATITSGATSLTLASVTGLTNATVFVGVIEPGVVGKEQTFTGIVDTSGLAITGVVWTRGSNTGHALGVTIVDYVTGTSENMRTKGALVIQNQDGTLKASVLGALYPVGSIYSSTVSTNPNTLFGFGTWAAFGAGKVMVGKAASGTFVTAGATGGEETHVLTTPEIPAHSHTTDGYEHGGGSGYTHSSGDGSWNFATMGPQTMSSTGGGGAHNNLQPYIVVYMWNRTA